MSGARHELLPSDLDLLAFLTDCQVRQLSPRTLEVYRYQLEALLSSLSDKPLSDATPTDIRSHFLTLQGRVGVYTQHQAFRVLRTFYRWLQAEGVRDDNPMARLKPPKLPQKPLDPLSMDTLKALLATCERRTFHGDRDRAALLCLLDSGCRASEFAALELADVNLATGTVIVRHGKGGKARATFLGAKSRRALLAYLRHRGREPGPLWQSQRGARLTAHGFLQMVRRRAKRAGTKPPSLHSFRRAFALQALRNGCDLLSLQRLLGHSDMSVLRRYLAQTTEDLQQAHKKAGPVDNLL